MDVSQNVSPLQMPQHKPVIPVLPNNNSDETDLAYEMNDAIARSYKPEPERYNTGTAAKTPYLKWKVSNHKNINPKVETMPGDISSIPGFNKARQEANKDWVADINEQTTRLPH